MLAKNVLVLPNVNNYKTKFEKCLEKYPFLVDTDKEQTHKPDTDQIAKSLSDALDLYYEDRKEFDRLGEICFGLGYKYESYESACGRISNDIESLLKLKPTLEPVI